MSGKPIVIRCRVEHCESVQVLMRDDYLPPDWICSSCEMQILEQQMDALHRREQARMALGISERTATRIASGDF